MSQINVNTIAPQSGSSVTFSSNVSATDVTGSFGRIEGNSVSLTGDLIAHRYLVSSSITNVVIATNSGSSAFGDTLDDVHRFTGSLELTGSVSASKFIGDGALLSNVFEGTAPSASISTRLTSFTDGSVSLVSGSSTSTGSFGELHIADRIGVNQTNPAALIHVKAPTTSDDAGITWSSAHPYNWSIGLDAGAGHYFKITNSDTPGGGTDYMSFGGQIVEFPSGVTQINMLADDIYIGNALRHHGEADVSIEFTANQIEFQANDQPLIYTPNHLSGSAASTGSFGAGHFVNKIGIGTTHPDVPLDVTASPSEYVQYWQDGTVQMTVYLSSSPYGWFGTRTNHDLRIGTNDSARIAIEAGGDVGIGTNNPSHKLDVNGTFRTVGAATFDSTIGSGAITSTGNIISTGANSKISGSATSTGSFGRGKFLGHLAVGAGATGTSRTLDVRETGKDPTVFVKSGAGNAATIELVENDSSAFAKLQMDGSSTGGDERCFSIVTGGNTRSMIFDHSANSSQGDQSIHFRTNGHTPLLTLNDNGQISGSAASTGSFGAVSVGGGTLPFGRVAINGANANVPNGPHIKLTTDSDVYPLFSVTGWQHDNISLFFDSYYDGATRSSDAGSNFRIHKNDDKLKFLYDSGVSPGSTQSYKEGILLDASGNVEVPTGNIISSKANGLISGSASSTGSFGHVKIGGSNIETFISSSAAADGFGGGGGGSGTGFPFDGQAQITGSLIISGAIHPMTASLHITDTSFTDTHVLSQSLVVAVDGNNGRLFSVTDQMSGSLFSANTVAGLPVIEAFSDNKVTLGPFSNQTVIDSDGNTTLGGSISGSLGSTGSFGRLLLNNRNGDVDIRNSVDGSMNVIIGDSTTGAAITTQVDNVIIGQGIAAVTGENNVYIGTQAGAANAAANNNVVVGYQALVGGNNNANNVAIGYRSLYGNNSGNQNTAVGYESGKGTSTGYQNAFFGYRSGDTNTTGIENVTLGSLADVTGTGASNQIAIGYNVTSTGDNQTVIGNSDQTHVVFGGSALISGSAASTGSFGQVKGDIIGQRPIVTHIADFSASMDFAGRYNIVHGGLTCSILTHATTAVDNGTEYEFFQTSSLGNMLFETGSGVSLYVKNDNLNIAGQYSGASLKKVATNTWHLVGDLT